MPSRGKPRPQTRASSGSSQDSVSPSTRSQTRANSVSAWCVRTWKATRRVSWRPRAGPSGSGNTAVSLSRRTRRRRARSGKPAMRPPLAVVTSFCSGSWDTRFQAVASWMGCRCVSGSSSTKRGCAPRSEGAEASACSMAPTKASRATWRMPAPACRARSARELPSWSPRGASAMSVARRRPSAPPWSARNSSGLLTATRFRASSPRASSPGWTWWGTESSRWNTRSTAFSGSSCSSGSAPWAGARIPSARRSSRNT